MTADTTEWRCPDTGRLCTAEDCDRVCFQAPAEAHADLARDLEMSAALMVEASKLIDSLDADTRDGLALFRWPLIDELDGAAGILRDRLEQSKAQPKHTNPNNCDACDHKRHPDGGWCYMFRDQPTEVCAKHTARASLQAPAPAQSAVAWLQENPWGGDPLLWLGHALTPKSRDAAEAHGVKFRPLVYGDVQAPAVQDGKPAAWIRWEWNRSGGKSLEFFKPDELSLADEARGVVYAPLYGRPLAPLSERAILDLAPTTMPIANDFDLLWFARAVERAHGIGKHDVPVQPMGDSNA